MERILLVDDDEKILNAMRREITQSQAYEVITFNDPLQALKWCERRTFSLVISDYQMPQMNGVEFLRQVRKIRPDAARIIVSGHADMARVLEAVNEAEVFRFLLKPWDEFELRMAIGNALIHQKFMHRVRREDGIQDTQAQRKTRDELLKNLDDQIAKLGEILDQDPLDSLGKNGHRANHG